MWSTNYEYAYSKQAELTPNLLSWGSMCTFFSHLLIPNPIHGKRMEVSIIVYFVKCDQIKLEAEWILCICMLVFQKWCPGFKSPSLKWAHHKTNTVWQQAGSLCSYEAQNLMSMNNEYYSTCWWLSRLPVIRSMKALFSREHSLSNWMMDSHHPPILHTGNNFSNAANQQMATDTSHHISTESYPWCLLRHYGPNGMRCGLIAFELKFS